MELFREMDYVYAVYANKSFSKAAEEMFLSQSSLSLMVKKAERRIGAPIFDRSSLPITLTEAGEAYIRAVEQIRSVTDTFRSGVGVTSSGVTVGVTFAALEDVASSNQIFSYTFLPKMYKVDPFFLSNRLMSSTSAQMVLYLTNV